MSVTTSGFLSRGMRLHLVMVLAMAATSTSHGVTPASETSRPDTVIPIPLNWRSLELRDSGLTGSVTTRIELKTHPATAVPSALVDAPISVTQRIADTRIQELAISSLIRLLVGAGIETKARLWFNEDDGLPLQLIRTRRGSKPSRKLYRFDSHRVYRLRRKPASGAEAEQPPEHWSEISESYYPLPDTEGECPAILESSQLLYLLSRPNPVFSENPQALCVFSRKQVYQVEPRVAGRERIDVDYLQLANGQETRVSGARDAIRVVLSTRQYPGAEADAEPFSFLGLKGEIQLLLSDPGRIPLQVRGQVPGYGMIDLELAELTR